MLRTRGELIDGRLHRDSWDWSNLNITTGWPRITHWGKQSWLREMLLDSNGVKALLREIHDLFDGELYVDGLLCFLNQAQIVDHFNLNPRNGRIKIIPGSRAKSELQNTSHHWHSFQHSPSSYRILLSVSLLPGHCRVILPKEYGLAWHLPMTHRVFDLLCSLHCFSWRAKDHGLTVFQTSTLYSKHEFYIFLYFIWLFHIFLFIYLKS